MERVLPYLLFSVRVILFRAVICGTCLYKNILPVAEIAVAVIMVVVVV
jgi:hypothetical protein